MKDRLFLLENEFTDADLPGRPFYCRDCITLNGLLAGFPERAAELEVIRVPHPRPREAVIEAIGVDNQWLPVLVFSDGGGTDLADDNFQGRTFVRDMPRLLHALHVRHGFPEPHP
jgi:hypothetical protein